MEPEIDWESCTFEGNRLLQQREFLKLSFLEKLKSVEAMCEVAEFFREARRRQGLPYVDPYTKKLVPGTGAAETPPEYRKAK